MIEPMKIPDASPASIADMAADWVARRDAGALSRDEERRLAGWLAEDSRHHGAYVRAQAAWTLAGRVTSTAKRSAPRLDRRAAALILATLTGGGLFGLARWRGSATRVATQRGEILRAPLRDGSLAVVNTDSRLAFDIGERRRTVRMSRGEAWFDVAKDPARPFTVALGDVRVQAVGTAFSVRAFETGVEVVVTEGVVALWNVRSDRKLVSLRTAGGPDRQSDWGSAGPAPAGLEGRADRPGGPDGRRGGRRVQPLQRSQAGGRGRPAGRPKAGGGLPGQRPAELCPRSEQYSRRAR
jgi:transmembrane sensor